MIFLQLLSAPKKKKKKKALHLMTAHNETTREIGGVDHLIY